MTAPRNGAAIRIRLGRPRDLRAIARFADVVVRNTVDAHTGVDGAERTLDRWSQSLTESIDGGLVHIAIAGEEIVGLVERGTIGGEPLIRKLSVTPSRRGAGIGARLLQVTIADIGPEHERVLLEHLTTDEDTARFCEREGFTVLRHDRSGDPESDLIRRVRQLDRAADDYASSAEFHEIHMDAVWDELGRVVADTFGLLSREQVLVDIGAGSGAGTVAIARRTACEILAVEPSTSMRSMLLVRLAATGVTDRVSVVAGGVPAVLDLLPERVHGVVGGHVLGHLVDEERRTLLRWLADHLGDDGAAVFTVSADTSSDPDAVHVDEHRVGRHLYRATHRSSDSATYESLFEVVDRHDGHVLRSCVVTGSWDRITAADLDEMLSGTGLRSDVIRSGVVVVRR